MAKFITAQEAAKLIPDGATCAVAGMGLTGWPEEIGCAIRDSFKETGHPCNLNMKQGCAMGDWKTRGITVLGEAGEGLVTKWSAAHIGSAFALNDLVRANKIQCHCLPQGVIVNLWREIAAHRPGLITKIGLGTFVDPRVNGGKMNDCTTDELVEVINFQGEEYLFYKSFKLDVALLRGTIADENGNITYTNDGAIIEGLSVAEAAKNSGGIVIVQVQYKAKKGTLHPKEVKIPGALVDYVVVATYPEACWQTEGTYYNPSFAGNIKCPTDSIPVLPLSDRKIICRRAAMELKKNAIINLGVGIPADVASIVAEAGYTEDVIMTAEIGNFGGVPAALPNFGSSYNPEATIEHNAMFDFYDGGGVDVAVLGFGESDQYGNVNASKFGPRLAGPGGFINISQTAKKVVFAANFCVKAKQHIENGKLVIDEDLSNGKKKWLKDVDQITFSGKYAAENDMEIIYITERCVFKLIDGKMTIVEVAPGIDVQKDVIDLMEYTPEIAKDCKSMPEEIFQEEWNGLDKIFA